MKDDQAIEALLARLQPAAPDDALMSRLRAAKPKPHRSRRMLYLWAPLAAAAVLAIALIPRHHPAPAAPVAEAEEAAEPQPVGSLQHLMDVADLGIVQDQNNMPVRLIRTRWIDEILYEPLQGGEPVKEGRLREEVLPLSLPIY